MTAWHLLSPELPPAVGGVGDYARQVAGGLAAAGEQVHLWAPAPADAVAGVRVHALPDGFRPAALADLDAALDREPGPRRLFVQWVPHGFGCRSLNLPFCLWLSHRAQAGDRVEVMVHEPFLAFGEGSRRQDLAAAGHRLMVAVLLAAAEKVWVAIPAWAELLRPWSFGRALGRPVEFAWLPLPATVPVAGDAAAAAGVRAALAPPGGLLIGSFGTWGPAVAPLVADLAPRLLAAQTDLAIILLGAGGERLRAELAAAHPALAGRLHAPGRLSPEALSAHLASLDLLVQPYPDGVSSRRTSALAALAHGVALATTAGRLSEPLWAESGAVALAPAGDPEALARAALDLAADPVRRARLAAAGRALYAARFALVRTVEALRRSE